MLFRPTDIRRPDQNEIIMDKISMQDWVASIEEILDNKLGNWKKDRRVENNESVQLRWSWVQTHVQLDIFWEDKKETVNLQYMSPRITHSYRWHGLNDKTFNKIMDRVGNLAQVTMHPPIDPMD